MSYEILYDKQFIKINDNLFAPIILAGSNNCCECGRNGRNGRRSRSWWNDKYICNNKHTASKEEILAKVDDIRQNIIDRNNENLKEAKTSSFREDVYNDDNFGYWSSIAIGGSHTSRTSFSMFKSFYITGMKKALTVEQLIEGGISIEVYTYDYNGEEKAKAKEEGIKFLERVFPKTTSELIEALKTFEENYKGTDFSWNVYFDSYGRYTEKLVRQLRNKHFPKTRKVREIKTFPFFFALHNITNGAYFYKRTKFGYKYSNYDDGGKRFLTETQAKQTLKKLERSYPKQFEIVRIEKETRAYA